MLSANRSRVRELDGIRGLAAIAVLSFHCGCVPTRALRYITAGGWCGVDVFFVLSGFLITRLLVSELDRDGTICLPSFYVRRALRLYPASVSAIILGTATAYLTWRVLPGFRQFIYLFTYGQNIWLAFTYFPAMNGTILLWPAWSLCIEEQFYLLWPITLRKIGHHRAIPVLIIIIALSVLMRSACYFCIHTGWSQASSVGNRAEAFIYYFTMTRLDVIGIGCVLGLSVDQLDQSSRLLSRPALWIYLAVVAAMVSFGVHVHLFYYTVGASVLAIGVGGVITAIWLGKGNALTRMLSARPLVEIGKVSYGIYLFQVLPVLGDLKYHLLYVNLQILIPIQSVIWAVSIFLIAELHYRLVETRFLALRTRTSPVRSRVVPEISRSYQRS
jgi:peptidoglycan/LPS O-acetylase OafA/YrhL